MESTSGSKSTSGRKSWQTKRDTNHDSRHQEEPLAALDEQKQLHDILIYQMWYAKCLQVSNLPDTVNKHSLATFLNNTLAAIRGAYTVGDRIFAIDIRSDSNLMKQAIVNMKTCQEASNALVLDGIIFEGAHISVKRPDEYIPLLGAIIGFDKPLDTLDMDAINAGIPHGAPIIVENLPAAEEREEEVKSNEVWVRHMRLCKSLYIGNLPDTVNKASLSSFINNGLAVIGGSYNGGGNRIISADIHEGANGRRHAFLHMKTCQEAANALLLNGIKFKGSHISVERPNKYIPQLGLMLGFNNPKENLNLNLIAGLFRYTL